MNSRRISQNKSNGVFRLNGMHRVESGEMKRPQDQPEQNQQNVAVEGNTPSSFWR